MNLKRDSVNKLGLTLVGIFGSVLVVSFSAGSVMGLGWHMLHGNVISYAGWTISVPKGFFAKLHHGRPSLWALAPGSPVLRSCYGRLTFYIAVDDTHPFSMDAHSAKFEATMSQAAGESGHRFQSRRNVPAGDGTAFCLEFTRQRVQPLVLERCAVVGKTLSIYYEGDPRYLPDFFNILQQMKYPH